MPLAMAIINPAEKAVSLAGCALCWLSFREPATEHTTMPPRAIAVPATTVMTFAALASR